MLRIVLDFNQAFKSALALSFRHRIFDVHDTGGSEPKMQLESKQQRSS